MVTCLQMVTHTSSNSNFTASQTRDLSIVSTTAYYYTIDITDTHKTVLDCTTGCVHHLKLTALLCQLVHNILKVVFTRSPHFPSPFPWTYARPDVHFQLWHIVNWFNYLLT